MRDDRMDELKNALGRNTVSVPSGEELNEAGIKWASYSLRTFTDEPLQKALKISEAIANFTSWLNEEAK